MKTYNLLLCTAFLLLASGCKESRVSSSSANEIEDWLIAFEASIPERAHNKHYSDTLFTKQGVFVVSTQPGTVDDDGRVSLAGESRTNGYFIAPRMAWVDTIQEAKRFMIEDMESDGGLPLAAYTEEAEQAVGGQPATPPRVGD